MDKYATIYSIYDGHVIALNNGENLDKIYWVTPGTEPGYLLTVAQNIFDFGKSGPVANCDIFDLFQPDQRRQAFPGIENDSEGLTFPAPGCSMEDIDAWFEEHLDLTTDMIGTICCDGKVFEFFDLNQTIPDDFEVLGLPEPHGIREKIENGEPVNMGYSVEFRN